MPREIFARLAGHRPDDAARSTERWLLLDEPETGLDPIVFARLMAMLVNGAADGKLRVICASHSPLAFSLGAHPNVQVVDLDGYAHRIENARQALADPQRCLELAEDELESLHADCGSAVTLDRGLSGQGRFTAHEAESIPYPSAIKPPYGKEECNADMRYVIAAAEERSPSPRRR